MQFQLCTHVLVYADDYMPLSLEVDTAKSLRVLTQKQEEELKCTIASFQDNARRSWMDSTVCVRRLLLYITCNLQSRFQVSATECSECTVCFSIKATQNNREPILQLVKDATR